jgi:uracil phosphoribosyltransferase
MLQVISQTNSIFSTYLSELRDVVIQKDPMRFRRNLERMAEIIGYEISKKLTYTTKEVTTPLGVAHAEVLAEQPVLATILRAGLPMHQGLLAIFDRAENAFVSAYRKHSTAENFEIHVEYMAAPAIDGKTLIISDPMLATGRSMFLVYKALLQQGNPLHVHIVSAIAAPEALAYLKQVLPHNVTIWVGAIDRELTAQSYIVPGLGDAGDLAFGVKC